MTEVLEPRELEEEDFLAFLEERVQLSLGLSLAEFVEQLQGGKLDPESPRVAGLAILVGARPR